MGAGEEGRSSAPVGSAAAAESAPEAASSSPLGKLTGFFDNILPSQLGGKSAAAAPADAASSSSPAQVEGQPSNAAIAAGAGAGAGASAAAAAAPYAFYSGEEGEGRAEGDASDATNPLNAQAAAAKRRQEAADREAAESNSTTGGTSGKAEIGSTNDPRIRSGASELNNRGACSGGWSSFMGFFACTGGDRASGNVPKPGEGSTKEEEEEKQQHK